MNLAPIIIMNLILLSITVLLMIADRLLVNYGECTITVDADEEKRELKVEGGQTLLNDLTENDVRITSSCGGKATCGYCKVKVKSGGGELLPTEEVFMSRQEKKDGVRLACQVKVKQDVEIEIPDLLSVVREIVKNRTFDPSLRWKFNIQDQDDNFGEKKVTKLSEEDRGKVNNVITAWQHKPGAIVPALQQIGFLFNYLPEAVLRQISTNFDIPLSVVYRVATFYNAFSLNPKGKNVVKVCLGTACYVKGGEQILRAVENKLAIKVGQATPDLNYSLEIVSCIGCCGQSPVISVNEDIYGYLKHNMLTGILKKYQKKESAKDGVKA